MFLREKTINGYTYLYLVESVRDGSRTRQRILKNLGRKDAVLASGDLFSEFSVVFIDTTTLAFTGAGGTTLGRRGHSKDHRPDWLQMIVGVVVDAGGRPICTEIWGQATPPMSALCCPSSTGSGPALPAAGSASSPIAA